MLKRPVRLVLAASALGGLLALGGCGGSSQVTHPRFELLVDRSSCQESAAKATIRCSIVVRNLGTAAGVPTAWVYYFFSDGASSFDYSRNGECRGAGPIPPGKVGSVFFCHSYDASLHTLIKAAASLDETATTYSYIRVASPKDASWPNR